jgi:serine/threonine-protein kinase RsbT
VVAGLPLPRYGATVGPAERPEEAGEDPNTPPAQPDVESLLPIVRRVVRARVQDPVVAEDLVQETVTRVLAAASRVQPAMIEPYAIATARNVVVSLWKEQDRHRRNQHRVLDLVPVDPPDRHVEVEEDRTAVSRALARLTERDRRLLLAHEVAGEDTQTLADELGSTPGAVAAQLNRTRARLRVEYLLALENADPPTSRCRAVLLALSSGDRRRQRDLEASRHLLECTLCARLSAPLLRRGQRQDDGSRIMIRTDADIVSARKAAREAAIAVGFGSMELTVIATAVSEVARNIVRFAGVGEVLIEPLKRPAPGLRITARDSGPGIADVEQALSDGFSTYAGLGLGLPGARRLMDDFEISSEVGKGTTVILTKWLQEGRR